LEPILTAQRGKNADVFRDISRLYFSPGDTIMDVTYGRGLFWSKVDASIYQLVPSDISTGIDCTNLPYPDESADVVIFDPPYMHGSGSRKGSNIKHSIDRAYKNKDRELHGMAAVIDLYHRGIKEGLRVLAIGGILVVKCMDQFASKQEWTHIDLFNFAISEGAVAEDLFVLVRESQPVMRHKHQKHARKNHSYFWIFIKRRNWTSI
jgi:hypothetical protein